MSPRKLKVGNRFTNTYYKLREGCSEGGASVTERGKGFSDYNILQDCVRAGWMRTMPAGPRGGIRYFTTAEGEAALAAAEEQS